MSDKDENSASGSSTPNSTSTYEYSHEPYETFQKKVLSLAHSLGDFEDVSLQRQRGGSYNRVIVAQLTTKNGETVKGIFRIPRFADEWYQDETEGNQQIESEVQDQAAVLQFLGSRNIAAPKLLAFDASGANAVRLPYVLQEYSTGVPLHTLYGTMSLKEKFEIVDALVDFLLYAEWTRFPESGFLGAAQSSDIPVKASYLSGVESANLPVVVRAFKPNKEDTQPTSLPYLMNSQLQAWYRKELEFGETNVVTAMWRRLCGIFKEMERIGFFQSGCEGSASITRSILYHWDLEPRNILVKHGNSEGRWEIDMVIDWDRVLVVPPILTRKPPVWLWDFSEDSDHPSMSSDYDGDVDLLPPSRFDVNSGRLSVDDQQIRL